MLNIIGHKNMFLGISAVFVGAAVLAIVLFGFRQGVDFSGGTLWQFKITSNAPQPADLESFFKKNLNTPEAVITYNLTNNSFLARLPTMSESDHQRLLKDLKIQSRSFEEMSFQSIGPSVGQELRQNALIAIALVLVGISLYIAFAFRKVYHPVSSWKYGVITLITLFHDVVIPAGLLAVLGRYGKIEIDGNFVVALLVVMGFSVHDTIVVFDRIRENLFLDRGKTRFGALINQSVNQSMARSLNTSLTLILVLLAVYLAGPLALHYFVLTLLVGVTTGIYSSIFVASPLLLVWQPSAVPR